MSFSAVAPSLNVLNGGSDAVQPTTETPKATVKAKVSSKVVKKASLNASPQTTPTTVPTKVASGSTQSTTIPATQHTTTSVGTPSTPSTPSPNAKPTFDPVFGGLIPLLLLAIILWGFWKFMVHSIRKNPPYGGYAHKHKRMHPGVPKPRVFK